MATVAVSERSDRAARRTRLFGTALVATLLTTGLDLPWSLTGIGFGVVVVYAGVRVLADVAALRRDGHSAPGRVGVIVGIGLTGVMLLVLLGQLALYPLVAGQQRCLAGALTHQDQKQCRLDYERRLQDLLRPFGASASPA